MNTLKTIIALFVIALFCSCDKLNQKTTDGEPETKASSQIDNAFFVSESDVFLKESNSETQKKYYTLDKVYHEGNIVAYLLNYEDGWKIYSADKRLDPVLAFSDNGNINQNSINAFGIKDWFSSLANKTLELRQNNSGYVSPLWDNHSSIACKEDGDNYKSRDTYTWTKFSSSSNSTVTTAMVEVDLPSKWGQGSPWNKKCPMDNNYIYQSNRSYVGCAAVALGQLLLYYNSFINTPSGIWESIDCSSVSQDTTPFPAYYNNLSFYVYKYIVNLQRANYNANSSYWNDMHIAPSLNHDWQYAQDSTSYVKVIDFLMDVGNRLNMKYSYWVGSGISSNTNLVSALSNYGLTGTISMFSDSIVRANINLYKPIGIMGQNEQGGGHVWVLDGYKDQTTTTVTTTTWYFGYTPGIGEPATQAEAREAAQSAGLDKPEDGMITTSYSNPINKTYYRMAWGNDGSYDGYYLYGSFMGYNYDLYLLHNIGPNNNQ